MIRFTGLWCKGINKKERPLSPFLTRFCCFDCLFHTNMQHFADGDSHAVALQVCSDTGLCSQKDALAVAAKQPLNGDIDCPLCEYLVITVKGDLEDPDTEAKVLKRANQVRSPSN